MKILSKFKIVSYLWIFIIWFASIYIVPEITRSYLVKYSQDLPSNEEVNMKKLKTIMDFETKAFEIIMWERLFELRHSLFAGGSDLGWKAAPTIKAQP